MITFEQLHKATLERQAEWDPHSKLSIAFRGNELAGEVGEACNVIKKLEREDLGLVGSRASLEDLADELADVVISTQIIASETGIDLGQAIQRKFNKTSDKYNLKTRL